jgi:hypothetical protein
MSIPKYFTVKTTLIPYFVYDGHKEIKFGKNKATNYLLLNKIKRLTEVVKGIFKYQFDIKKYEFDTEKFLINLELKTKSGNIDSFFKYSEGNTLKEKATDYIRGEYYDAAADTWMSGDITLIDENVIDSRLYEFYFKFKKLEVNMPEEKKRPSPSESATGFAAGTVKKGNDGNMYRVVVNKNGIQRWQKV